MELTFEELRPLAKEIFRVWVDCPEIEWAAQMWEHVAASGLTQYSDDFEMHTVLFRFLALGGIYHDFCMLGFEERNGTDYAWWLAEGLEHSELQADWFIIGQMAADASDHRHGPPYYSDERANALICPVEQHRREVYDALIKAVGWDYALLISLCGSILPNEADDWDDDVEDYREVRTSEDVLSSMYMSDAGNVFDWIQDGCPARQYMYDRL